MKKTVLLILTISQVLYLNAQSLVVTGDNFVLNPDPCLQSHASLSVKNVSSNTLNVLCQKVIIDTSVGTDNFFCWGGNCYGATTYISSSSNNLLPGEGDNIDFGGYYDAYCDPASAVIEYCFYPDSDVTDKTCITITYNPSATDVNDLNELSEMSEFFPNPANSLTHFTFNGTKAKLKIIDILGNEIKVLQLEGSAIKRIDLTDMSKGVYFGKLLINNKVTTIKKLIVN